MPLSATASGCGSQNKSNPISSSFQNKILPQTSIFHNESLIYHKHKYQPIDNICQHHLSHELLVLAVWFFELKELICKSSNCLNMSFMEWIIWSSPNFSGMGLYRVDCIPSILHTLFFFHFSIFSWWFHLLYQHLLHFSRIYTGHVCGKLILDIARGTLHKFNFQWCSRR